MIYNSKLEPSLDVQTNIQCGFECDQCLSTPKLFEVVYTVSSLDASHHVGADLGS